ncbi:MAG: MMPL family transporter, partial [Candidatus Heimdallarchaeota archaeon]
EEEIEENLNQVLTGTVANVVDTLEVSESSFRNSEIIAGLVIFIILFIVFRTPLAIFIPLLSTIAALFPAYLISAILGQLGVIVINSFLPAVIAMIGIAVAVDYNLFSLVRYREEYRKRRAEYELNNNWNDNTRKETEIYCSQKMNNTAGQAAMYSGITTLIGFSSLLITQNEFSVAMAIGVSLVVAMSILTTRSLTPAILAFAGRYLDWPNVLSRADKEIEFNKEKNIDLQGFWVKWSRLVMKRPLVFLLIGIIIMMPFVVLSAQTELSFSLTKGLPPGTESREGFEILEEKFNLGDLNPYIVIIDAGETNNSIFNNRLIESVNQFSAAILNYSGYYDAENKDLNFDTVTTMSALFNSSTNEMNYFDMAFLQDVFDLPDNITLQTPFGNFTTENPEKSLFLQHVKQYINWEMGNNTLQIEITSNLDPGSGAAWELVNIITDYVNEYFQSLIDDSIIEQALVTGFTALIKESSDGLYERVPLMLVVAVLLIFLSLLVLFRSVILPIKAILTIAGSILFGMGTLVYIFQFGYLQLIEFLGFTLWEAELSGITYFLPTFLFTTILGLGMDYSIFIISRIKEEYEKSGDMDESVGVGLTKTAGIITSAATIMTATFLVFAASPLLTLKMMGLAMAVAIVIDATIARTILLPAAMRLAGVYNFWIPKWLEKILPDVKLEH